MEEILFYKMAWRSLQYSYAQVINFLHFDKMKNKYYALRASEAKPSDERKRASEQSKKQEKIHLEKLDKKKKWVLIGSRLYFA